MHILVIFLVLLLLTSMVVWAIAQPKEKLQKAWSDIAAPFTSKTRDWGTPLKVWAEASLGNERQLQTWLLALPSEGLQALGEKIAEFCNEMNVDLTWLTDTETDTGVNPVAKQAAEEMVIDYCKICLKAVQNQQTAK